MEMFVRTIYAQICAYALLVDEGHCVETAKFGDMDFKTFVSELLTFISEHFKVYYPVKRFTNKEI